VAQVRLITAMVLSLLGAAPVVVLAQSSVPLERGSVISPVLTIDSERLFVESDFGQRIISEAEARGAELSAENRKVEADLEAEEQALTAQRADLTPEEFRDLADAFDAKVQSTRTAQTAKGRAINEDIDRAREVLFNAAAPVLEKLMRDAGAAVILERRSVFASNAAIEITEDAIALLNDTLGNGAE
jgi:Skp family chaperone for outer membrane proteins